MKNKYANETDEIEIQEEIRFQTKKEPRKSFASFQRNENKAYINALNMIDRKSAIMIRVNSTIISAIMIFYHYMENSVSQATNIAMVMIVCSGISLYFAINASRPHLFMLKKSLNKNIHKNRKAEEKIFFSTASEEQMTLEEYEIAYNKVVSSQALQIGNQVRAMYVINKQLKRAFIQIEVAYLAFMLGFFISVILFIISNLNLTFN
ncbi:hypothetical protein [Soonwooa sp.]|uniref:hypothetical protein n=1 Tax=Soonwooa sp. TaxID=1938592 RepID=UPI00289C33E7|nr:hypothetical protein [Soonwooa sp.]